MNIVAAGVLADTGVVPVEHTAAGTVDTETVAAAVAHTEVVAGLVGTGAAGEVVHIVVPVAVKEVFVDTGAAEAEHIVVGEVLADTGVVVAECFRVLPPGQFLFRRRDKTLRRLPFEFRIFYKKP